MVKDVVNRSMIQWLVIQVVDLELTPLSARTGVIGVHLLNQAATIEIT